MPTQKKTISTQPNAWKIDPRCTWNNGTKKNNNNSKCPENLHQEQTPYLTFSWKSSRRPRFPVHRVVYATCESHVRNYMFPLLENVYVLCLINDKCLFCYFCSVFVCCSLFCRCHLARDFLVSQGCGIFCHVTCFRLFFKFVVVLMRWFPTNLHRRETWVGTQNSRYASVQMALEAFRLSQDPSI